MPFIENHARILRILGAPFTPFYAAASGIRNLLYRTGVCRSKSFPFPVICVGNLCAGGSGKTPMTEYLVRLLSARYHVGVVSRGYGRKSKENLLADVSMGASRIGDEPMQYLLKFSNGIPHGFSLYLSADREKGISELKALRPDCHVVILDDAYQHRRIRAGLNILLTEYENPYFRDYPLPLGTLRESRRQSRRADIIVVTKCPDMLSEEKKQAFLAACRPLPHQKIYFSRIGYERIVPVVDGMLAADEVIRDSSGADGAQEAVQVPDIFLFTGIAHPAPMERYLRRKGFRILRHLRFGDHHAYTAEDLRQIAEMYRRIATDTESLLLLTTEKDFARLQGNPAFSRLKGIPLAVLPIRTGFLFGEGAAFDRRVENFLTSAVGDLPDTLNP